MQPSSNTSNSANAVRLMHSGGKITEVTPAALGMLAAMKAVRDSPDTLRLALAYVLSGRERVPDRAGAVYIAVPRHPLKKPPLT